MTVTIREMRVSDIPEIMGIHSKKGGWWASEISGAAVRKHVEKNGRFQLVAEDSDGRIVGAIHVARKRIGAVDRSSKQVSESEGFPARYADVCGRHDANGNALFAFMVASSAPGAGKALVLELLERAKKKGLRLFTYSPLFDFERKTGTGKKAGLGEIERYINGHGDSVHSFHTKLGARLIKIIPNGRPSSPRGAAISFEYETGAGE